MGKIDSQMRYVHRLDNLEEKIFAEEIKSDSSMKATGESVDIKIEDYQCVNSRRFAFLFVKILEYISILSVFILFFIEKKINEIFFSINGFYPHIDHAGGNVTVETKLILGHSNCLSNIYYNTFYHIVSGDKLFWTKNFILIVFVISIIFRFKNINKRIGLLFYFIAFALSLVLIMFFLPMLEYLSIL